jgi:hypothetical protein
LTTTRTATASKRNNIDCPKAGLPGTPNRFLHCFHAYQMRQVLKYEVDQSTKLQNWWPSWPWRQCWPSSPCSMISAFEDIGKRTWHGDTGKQRRRLLYHASSSPPCGKQGWRLRLTGAETPRETPSARLNGLLPTMIDPDYTQRDRLHAASRREVWQTR